ncbi:MAG: DNA adenine methylase [Corynebacterium sp.]|nr:DNA adenine methylase [Corynebacterium sp.]
MTATSISPIVKWVGGKRQLLNELLPRVPESFGTYYEPFIGGAAMLCALAPERAVINDVNDELIGLYRLVASDVDALVARLQIFENTEDEYYAVREWDRDQELWETLTPVDRAARLIFLNKTCFNGLFRVNAAGQFNVPYGRYTNPKIVNEEGLRALADYFSQNTVRMTSRDYASVVADAVAGDFVYLDPPYDPVSDTSSFTGYAKNGFGKSEQRRLKETCDALDARGVKFMLSNSATPFIRELYADYNLEIIAARRAVNSVGARRGAVDEVVVRNYG